MRYLVAAAHAVGAVIPQTLSAQHDSTNPGHDRHSMMMMRERHHSAGAVDSLIFFRDSLQLTDWQVEQLVDLKEQNQHLEHHSMMKGGDAMMHRRWVSVRFDRVPGKMVPRGRRVVGECCPSCPLMVLSKAQRQRAHELLGHDHEGW
jgi:hypothetical protein